MKSMYTEPFYIDKSKTEMEHKKLIAYKCALWVLKKIYGGYNEVKSIKQNNKSYTNFKWILNKIFTRSSVLLVTISFNV